MYLAGSDEQAILFMTQEIVMCTLEMPDGKMVQVPMTRKQFSSGKTGYYAQIPLFVGDAATAYKGQVMFWKVA